MFFNGWLQRKLASVLRPWLRQDSELEVKLGFLRSHGIAKNLCFDTDVLTQQLDDSARFAFTDFRIDELKLGVSNWSFPAFRIDVDGLHVTLTLREIKDEDRANQRGQTVDTSTEDMKKVLSKIDPEGIALNDAMESLSTIICSYNRKTSILCTILGHCHLRIRRVDLLVQCPTSNHPYSCMLEMNDFDIKSGFTVHRYFLQAVISSLLLPSAENSFELGVKGFTVGLKDKDSINNIFSSRYLQTSIALKDLRLVKFNLSNPELELTISPSQISIITAMSKLSTTESNCARNGKQLWSIAASRYNSLLPARRWSFQKLVNVVCLWLRYVHAYEHLLLSIGYPVDEMLNRSVIMMSHDKQFSVSVKRKWNEISTFEKDLPLEAAVLARRLVRCRVSSSVNQSKDISVESLDIRHSSFIWKILNLLVTVWSYICSTCYSIILLALRQSHYVDHLNNNGQGIASNNACLQHCFSVNIGIISITICPEKAVERSVSGRAKSDIGISYSNLLSFCFSVDTLYFLYKEYIFDRFLSFSCGNVNAMSSSVIIDSLNNYDSHLKGRKKKYSDPVLALWGQPAQVFDYIDANSFPFVGGQLKEMWSTWKTSCAELENGKVLFPEHPFILCEIKDFLTDQGFSDKSFGFKNCCLVIGELNVILDYASVVSVVLILKQIQSALYRSDCSLEANVPLDTPVTCEDPLLRSWDNKYNSCASEMEMQLYKLLPHEHIQAAVFVAGPQIRISLNKEGFLVDEAHVNSMHDEIHIVFNIRSVELGVKPTLGSDLESSSWGQSIQNEPPACPRLKEPELTCNYLSDEKICKCQARSTLDAHLKVNGLIAYLDTKNQQDEVIVLNPTTIRLSSIRKELHSFGATIVAFSAALHWITTELAVMIFTDEFSILVKVVDGLTSLFTSTTTFFDSDGFKNLDGSGRGHSGNTGTVMRRVNWGNLIESSTGFVINCTYEIKAMDIVLNKSRERNFKDHTADTLGNKWLTTHEVLDYGVIISIKESRIGISYMVRDVDVLASFSVLRAGLFNSVNDVLGKSDKFCVSNVLQHSMNFRKELSFSDCTFALWLRCLVGDSTCERIQSLNDPSDCDGEVLNLVEESQMATDNEGSVTLSPNTSQKFSGSGQSIGPASSLRILVNVSLSEIYFAGSAVKDLLFGEHNLNKLKFSLSIGENCRRISCLAQGGSIFLEAEAVAMFFQCLTSYEQCLRQVLPAAPLPKQDLRAGTVENVVVHNNHHSQGSQTTHQNVNHDKLAKLVISLSEISLVLMARDELGILQEILFVLDVHLDVDMDEQRKFLLRLSQFSIISRILHEGIEQQSSEIQISQSSSDVSNHPSSLTVIGNTTEAVGEDPTIPITGGPTTAFQQMRGIPSALDEAGSSGHSISPIESYTDTTRSKVSGLSPQNCILKHLSASLALEKFMSRDIRSQQYWVGGGSISGFEMTISLQEIQIILSMMEIMSGFLSKKQTNNIEQKYLTRNQEPERKFEDVVPDGAVVALQDVHHHMYITVEGGQNNYKVVGSIHYSVVGDRALFRVKYHYQRRWGSTVLWISLTSLYAKSDSGEPLRLNCRAGSSFVDISSSSDSVWALWKIYPFKAVNYYGDTEVDSYCPVATNRFHLINRKNDRGIAFVDDSLECMSKPGNPFKLKVFQDYALAGDINVLAGDTYPAEALENGIKEGSERTESQTCISIEVDKCIVTIVHEISTTKEKIPLLQLSIVSQELLMQILHVKARIMSRLNVVLYYFDAQRNLWSELLHPAEISLFFRYRFQIAGIETILPTVPVHFYGKIKQLDISMTELSLDILLFVIGELNLAGPFAVRSSVILANCCKVENQSGLTLLCHFHQNQYASVARNQSSMVFLRHLALVSQTSKASSVTVQFTDQGSFTTSPINISLLEARTFAWRTRIVSSQEPKTYPGPFIVVEVSRRRGDGLSLAVSPLLRIHNETDFSMELRFQRPEHKESESASVILKAGDTIDDTLAAFRAINLSGGSKKALVSVSVGNYLFSFRPEITEDLRSLSKLHSVEWSNDLKGGKAIYLSGLFDKLGYKVRKALSTESVKCSFSIAHCSLKSEEGHIGDIDFLIQSIGRDIPVIQPDSTGYTSSNRNSHVALQEQKEIFILPTIQISNLLQSEVEVFLSDKDSQISRDKIGKFAIVPCKSTSNLYANPATIYFTFTLTAYNSSCKPVNCADWVKKLQKQKSDVNSLDIELDFGSGKYFAFLRLAFKDNGILEAAIFTPYTLKNETEFLLFCCGPNQKPLARYEAGNLDSEIPPELGSFLPAKSTSSWFIKCNKVRLILLDKNESHTILDLDALSGLTEIDLEVEGHGCNFITKLGVSLKLSTGNVSVPSRTVSINPRYMVSNESEETIIVRQCYLEDEMQGVVGVNGKQRTAVHLRNVAGNKKEISVFDKILRHHKSARDDSLLYVQFKPKDAGFDWSGPVCVTSLGRFFLKFKRLKDYPAQDISNHAATPDHEYSSVNVIEEDSTLVLHFYRPPHTSLPYRIENCLEDAPITYYQKGSSEPEVIGAGGNVDYVWDDSNLPHKLVIQISEVQLLREINLDKLRAWKPFYRAGKQRGLGLQLPLHRNPGDKRRSSSGQLNGIEIITSGFEVYADGPTRVLRICEFPDSHKANTSLYSGAKMQLRVFDSAISILEPSKKERDVNELPTYTPIIVLRLGNIYMDSILTNHRKCNSLRVQSLSVDEKWIGAPFASMIRRHHSQYPDTDTSMLHVVFILLSTSSEVKHVEYSSIVLQPFDLNLDEETLMRIAPFWRTSLSDPHTKSQQYYFDHFEIHPIKIIASFLPGEFYSSYSSTQETLRSLLHSVIKIPAIKHKSVELNGVLVTHAMITVRELSIKCAQHYSWYAMRAIYIAKGSPLLPPAFASIFDDSASSSLDVFFDPSSGLINLPGLTIGTFKLISKSIDSKGFSGTKRYFGDLGKTLKAAGSNILFVAATEISDSILKGAETSGFNGMVSGFHQGVLKLAMEPTLLGTALIEGGPDRKIKLDRNPGVDELYIEGYLQAMLDAMYKQEYLRVRVIDDQVILKNLPPSSSLIEEIMDRVKGFLVSKTLLKGDSSSYRPLRHIRGESDWKIGPTILTLCEHLFVSFMIRGLRKQAGKVTTKINLKEKLEVIDGKPIVAASVGQEQKGKGKVTWRLGIGRFVLSGLIAYLDGRLCRCIPNPIARRIVSGFLLTFLDQNDQ